MARLSARCPMVTAALEYPPAIAASACRTSSAARLLSLRARMTFRTARRPDARQAVCPGRWRPLLALRTSQDVARIALPADASRAAANLASVI